MLDSSLLIFIQIVSESFPVSSSGHIALAVCVIAYYNLSAVATLRLFFSSSSLIFLAHIPTIFIVTFFFRDIWLPLFYQLHRHYRVIIHLIMYTCIADCITALSYFLLKIVPLSLPLSVGFTITAGMLFSLRWRYGDRTILKIPHMILLGCAQSVALLPGISRFGTIYVVCRWFGIRPSKAFGITWMLQWPLMTAGAILGLAEVCPYALIKQPLFLGYILITTFIAYGGFYTMYRGAEKNLLWLMSIYMLIPIIVSLIIGC